MDEACKVACGGFVVSVSVGLFPDALMKTAGRLTEIPVSRPAIPVSRPVFTAGGVIGVGSV